MKYITYIIIYMKYRTSLLNGYMASAYNEYIYSQHAHIACIYAHCAGFYSDVVECLPLNPAAQVRFPPRAVGIFLDPVTFGGQ